MKVYTVHAPPADVGLCSAVDRFVFVRDGFHFWAFAAGLIWLAWHRLWLALFGTVVVLIGAAVAMSMLHTGAGAAIVVLLLFALLIGFEAASLWRWTLSRRKWRQIDVVVADDAEAAERRFFDRWIDKHRAMNGDQSPIDRGGPPPTRDTPGQPFSRPPSGSHEGIIGLFPQPGASH